MTLHNNKGNTFLSLLLLIVITLTNLSQLPFFVSQNITQIMVFPIWIFLLIYCILKNNAPQVTGIKKIIIYLALFSILYFFLCLVDNSYSRSSLPYSIYIATFVLFVSTCLGKKINQTDLNNIYTIYIISSLILSIAIYSQYIAGQSIESSIYLYEEKNSISQILLTTLILIFFTKLDNNSFFVKLFYITCAIFVIYELMALKSRASIIGIPITLLFGIYNGNNNNLRKISLIITSGIFILFIIKPNLWQFIIDNVILASRDSVDLNDISSGRSNEWENFFKDWKFPLMGQGRCKRESIILTSLLEFGIIGGIPILLIALQPLIFCIKKYKYLKSNINFIILFVISINYCINGIFEQLAPFGPGVKCYFLWFLYGIITSMMYQSRKNKLNNTHI